MILRDLGREEREEAYPRGRLSCREATIGLPKRNSNIQTIYIQNIFGHVKHTQYIAFLISDH